METIRIKFDEVSNISYGGAKGIQGTYFDFKSGDLEVQRAYVVGTPIVESGIEVTAAVHRKGKWNLIVGWINHTTGETSIQWSGHQLILGFICLIGMVLFFCSFTSRSNINLLIPTVYTFCLADSRTHTQWIAILAGSTVSHLHFTLLPVDQH